MNVKKFLTINAFIIGSMAATAIVPQQANAFGLSDITGAVKKVGSKVKGAAETVGRDIKNTSKIIGKNAKDWGTSVGAAAKNIGRGGKWVGKRVVGGAKLMGDDLKIAGKAVGRAYQKVVPCPLNGKKCHLVREGAETKSRRAVRRSTTSARALPPARNTRVIRKKGNRALPPARYGNRHTIARDKSVWGRPVGIRKSDLYKRHTKQRIGNKWGQRKVYRNNFQRRHKMSRRSHNSRRHGSNRRNRR